MIICWNNLYFSKTLRQTKRTEKEITKEKSFITVLEFLLSSIYMYGFQSLGDDGLREFDETVDDDDEDDNNEEDGLAELIMDE